MRIGSVAFTWSPKHNPFTWLIKTTYFAMGHPIEGPQYVRQLTHFLYFVISWDAPQARLDAAKAMWNSPENKQYREQAKAEYERYMKEQGQDVPRIH